MNSFESNTISQVTNKPLPNHRYDPESMRTFLNDLPILLGFVYGMHISHIHKQKTQKHLAKNQESAGGSIDLWIHVQTTTSLLQNFHAIEPKVAPLAQLVGDMVSYYTYPISYFRKQDIISYRPIEQTNNAEIVMLAGALMAHANNFFVLTGNWYVVGVLIVTNKIAFGLAQVLKTNMARDLSRVENERTDSKG